MDFNNAKEEIRERISIVDFISRYVNLKKTGSNYIGLCPFHNEKTPSFFVNDDKHMYKCFGCGKSGDIFNFLMEYEKIDFVDALKILAKEINIQIDFSHKNYNNEYDKLKETLYKIYKDVANEYYKILRSEKGKQGQEYFKNRKISLDTIIKFGLGYAPNDYKTVYRFLKNKGYSDDLILKTGLVVYKNNNVHDLFVNRVVFPIVDKIGKVIAFSARVLESGKVDYKYINSPETLIYKKSNNVFGLYYAKKSHEKYYILCEGNLDVIMMHQAGFGNAIASLGTSLTEEQARLISRDKKEIIISYDSDNAGIEATKRAISILEEQGFNIKILDLKPSKDPDEFIKQFGKNELEKRLVNAKNSFLYIISLLKKQYDLNNPKEYEKYIDEIIKKLSVYKDKIIRDQYIKQVALQEKLDENELKEAYSNRLKNIKIKDSIKTDKIINADEDENLSKNEIILLNYIFANNNLIYKIKEYLKPEDFVNKKCKIIYNDLLSGLKFMDIYDKYKTRNDDISKEISNMLFNNNDKYEIIKDEDEQLIQTISELIKKIKENTVKNKINSLDNNTENFSKLADFTKEIKEIKNMRIDLQ